MKKTGKRALVTATLVSAAMTMGGCRFLPWANSNANVYGPPPEEFDPKYNIAQPEYGVPYYEEPYYEEPYEEEPTPTETPIEEE